jgi:hypothetical protein
VISEGNVVHLSTITPAGVGVVGSEPTDFSLRLGRVTGFEMLTIQIRMLESVSTLFLFILSPRSNEVISLRGALSRSSIALTNVKTGQTWVKVSFADENGILIDQHESLGPLRALALAIALFLGRF